MPDFFSFYKFSSKRVTVTRRIIKSFLRTEIRRVNGESPVSNSESDLIYNKKRTKQKTYFFGSTRSNLELLTGIVRSKTITTFNNNINFVFVLRRISVLPDFFSFYKFSAKRVTVTRRIIKSFLQTEIRRVNGESPVSRSKTDKKGSNHKISPIRFGAAEPTSVEQF